MHEQGAGRGGDPPEPELLDTAGVCAMCNFKPRTWARMVKEGRAPQPIRPTGKRLVRWVRAEVKQWYDAKCPHWGEWVAAGTGV